MRLLSFCAVLGLAGCASIAGAPSVTHTYPASGAKDVPAGLTELHVTFDRVMRPDGFAFAPESADTFPKMTGAPRPLTVNSFAAPVLLEPGRHYVVWLNSPALKNFRDRGGAPAEPFRLEFDTAPSGKTP